VLIYANGVTVTAATSSGRYNNLFFNTAVFHKGYSGLIFTKIPY